MRFTLQNSRKVYLSEADVYSGFGVFSRKLLLYWKNKIVRYSDYDKLRSIFNLMSNDLLSNNVIVFFDHHYAFDAIPLGLALAQHVENVTSVMIPYSVHLEMGVGREGEPSLRYFLRTKAFQWFVGKIKKNNQDIQFFPVVREFEKESPRLSEIVNQQFSGVNTVYLKTLMRKFTQIPTGQLCFLTPFSGIGFPDKPVLHPQLYRSLDLVQGKSGQRFPVYIFGAYPGWQAYSQYYAPLLSKHNIVMRGSFLLPQKDYAKAYQVVNSEIIALRQNGSFVAPDYSRILNK
jgi:hypothetical protein